jgi:RNA polymerase sigma-70 factor, ECF subfamily
LTQPFPSRAFALPAVWEGDTEHCAVDRPIERASAASDEELLVRLKQQDRDALALLYERYSRLILTIGFRILRDRGEAEDLVQTVFLYLYQRAELYEADKGAARSWILQVTYHRALDKRTYLARRQFYLGTDLIVSPDTLSGGADVEREAGLRLNGEQLLEAIAELPEKQRTTLELYFFEGSDWQEISERLGDSVANVRHHYYRGLEKLRKNPAIQRLKAVRHHRGRTL